MIKDVKERQMALEIRLPNASKSTSTRPRMITIKAVIRLAHRYAELAREMAAKEKKEARKAELIAQGAGMKTVKLEESARKTQN